MGCSCNSQLTQGGLAGCRACHRKSTVTTKNTGPSVGEVGCRIEVRDHEPPVLVERAVGCRVRVARVVRAWFVRARAAQQGHCAMHTPQARARARVLSPLVLTNRPWFGVGLRKLRDRDVSGVLAGDAFVSHDEEHSRGNEFANWCMKVR